MPIRSASSTSSSWRRNISECVEFSRGVVVDQIASRISHPPVSSDGRAARGSQLVLWSPPRRVSSIAPGSFCCVGEDIQPNLCNDRARKSSSSRWVAAEKYSLKMEVLHGKYSLKMEVLHGRSGNDLQLAS